MKIVRYFIHEDGTDNEDGLEGFLPLWVPKAGGFDPSSARGMVHDMLEHRLCDRGAYHEEAMALGRVIATRGINGVEMSLRRSGSLYSFAESLGVEQGGAWWRANDPKMKAAPKTGKLERHVERAIEELTTHCMKTIASDRKHDGIEAPMPGRGFARHLESWLRIGYLDALRRYRGENGCYQNGYAAFSWARENEKRFQAMAESVDLGQYTPGFVLRMCWDTELLEMTERVIEPCHKYGRFPGWLRRRVNWWANA